MRLITETPPFFLSLSKVLTASKKNAYLMKQTSFKGRYPAPYSPIKANRGLLIAATYARKLAVVTAPGPAFATVAIRQG